MQEALQLPVKCRNISEQPFVERLVETLVKHISDVCPKFDGEHCSFVADKIMHEKHTSRPADSISFNNCNGTSLRVTICAPKKGWISGYLNCANAGALWHALTQNGKKRLVKLDKITHPFNGIPLDQLSTQQPEQSELETGSLETPATTAVPKKTELQNLNDVGTRDDQRIYILSGVFDCLAEHGGILPKNGCGNTVIAKLNLDREVTNGQHMAFFYREMRDRGWIHESAFGYQLTQTGKKVISQENTVVPLNLLKCLRGMNDGFEQILTLIDKAKDKKPESVYRQLDEHFKLLEPAGDTWKTVVCNEMGQRLGLISFAGNQICITPMGRERIGLTSGSAKKRKSAESRSTKSPKDIKPVEKGDLMATVLQASALVKEFQKAQDRAGELETTLTGLIDREQDAEKLLNDLRAKIRIAQDEIKECNKILNSPEHQKAREIATAIKTLQSLDLH